MSFNDLQSRRDGALLTVELAPSPTVSYLGERLLFELTQTLKNALSDPSIAAVSLRGGPGGFLGGADVGFFVSCLLANDLDRILRFTRSAQGLLSMISESTKPVVAWVNGVAMGAGLELALACHGIAAGPTAKFALPETGLGIYPGMGGTQRTPRRIGLGLAKWLIYTGSVVPAAQALEIGLIGKLSPTAPASVEAIASFSADQQPRDPLNEKFAALDRLFAERNVATLLNSEMPMPAEPQSVRALIQLRGKAPLALRLAEVIIDRGASLPLGEAIELEFSRLAEIFRTEDARTGLLSLGKTQPTFVGR